MLDQTIIGPTLTASVSGGNVAVSWAASGTYTLQYSLNLKLNNWLPAGTPVTVNGISTVTLPATNSAEFFRLAP
jgi:ribose 1,5-bisphosphokinase PhnN